MRQTHHNHTIMGTFYYEKMHFRHKHLRWHRAMAKNCLHLAEKRISSGKGFSKKSLHTLSAKDSEDAPHPETRFRKRASFTELLAGFEVEWLFIRPSKIARESWLALSHNKGQLLSWLSLFPRWLLHLRQIRGSVKPEWPPEKATHGGDL